jgi:hypothetical protein
MNESYWNDKWPKSPIIYNARTLKTAHDRIGVDVKNFIKSDDEILKSVIQKYNLKKPTFDETALAIQQFVVGTLQYKYDVDVNLVPEFWQFPFETLYSKVGDCEDGAILITSLCVNAGIPEWRVKVAAGAVQPKPTAPEGGHGYSIYLADDNEWRILDWCYYQDSSIPINEKPLAKNGGQMNSYKGVWFTFNSQYSWNQTSLCVEKRLSNDAVEKSTSTYESVSYNFDYLDYI